MTFRRVQDAGRQLGFGTETVSVSKAMEFLKPGGTSKENLWLPSTK